MLLQLTTANMYKYVTCELVKYTGMARNNAFLFRAYPIYLLSSQIDVPSYSHRLSCHDSCQKTSNLLFKRNSAPTGI